MPEDLLNVGIWAPLFSMRQGACLKRGGAPDTECIPRKPRRRWSRASTMSCLVAQQLHTASGLPTGLAGRRLRSMHERPERARPSGARRRRDTDFCELDGPRRRPAGTHGPEVGHHAATGQRAEWSGQAPAAAVDDDPRSSYSVLRTACEGWLASRAECAREG